MSGCPMDIFEIIQQLREERERVDRVIRSLEALMNGAEPMEEEISPKRRGRKSMSQDERLQVSQRMRKYWKQRRKK